jgi:predicted transcriptional regulator
MSADDKRFLDSSVADVFEKVGQPASIVDEKAKLGDVVDAMVKNPLSRKVYVVDKEQKVLGVVDADTVLKLIGHRVGVQRNAGLPVFSFLTETLKENATDFMRKVRPVTRNTQLTAALQIMLDDKMADLPVVDENGRIIGELISIEMLSRAGRMFEREE